MYLIVHIIHYLAMVNVLLLFPTLSDEALQLYVPSASLSLYALRDRVFYAHQVSSTINPVGTITSLSTLYVPTPVHTTTIVVKTVTVRATQEVSRVQDVVRSAIKGEGEGASSTELTQRTPVIDIILNGESLDGPPLETTQLPVTDLVMNDVAIMDI
jgi:hypothetical protein